MPLLDCSAISRPSSSSHFSSRRSINNSTSNNHTYKSTVRIKRQHTTTTTTTTTNRAVVLSAKTHAHQLLDQIPLSDTFAWNTLIRAHISEGQPRHAILVYRQMLLCGARADKHTIPNLITASRLSSGTLLFEALQLHCHALKLGLGSNDYVITSLMEMYAHFIGAGAAVKVFRQHSLHQRNSISWTLLAKLHLMEGKPNLALQVFYRMAAESKAEIDSVALVTALRACIQLKAVHEGNKVREIARTSGLEFHLLVGNMLLKMYIASQRIEEARGFFERMPVKDAASWTTMINGYVQNGGFNEGLKLFRRMSAQSIRPDSFSVSAVLPACARTAAHKHGKEIHAHVVRNLLDENSTTVQNALMDMYVKSGSIEDAWRIFARMAHKDAISWTVMIVGYSLHGQGEVGLALFRDMEKQRQVPPDDMAYTAALHACACACMVEEGKLLFDCIRGPKRMDHYAFMVDLLSRAGRFDEARAFVEEHQIGHHARVQRCMLNGCRTHNNVKLGERIAEQLVEIEPLNAENYVLLSNVYSASGKLDMADAVRDTIWDMGLKPDRAYSWIEVRGKVHVFGAGDASHPRSKAIYLALECLRKKMEADGLMLEANFGLHDVDEESGCVPWCHSEMLAITFGLISIQNTMPVRVTKNHSVCPSCHGLAKRISEIVDREVVLKDPHRFHHFNKGFCSCRDAW